MTEPGIWRFTFDGVVHLTGTGQATIAIEVVAGPGPAPQPIVKARSIMSSGEYMYDSLYPISINTLVQVEVNDTVRIRWVGTGSTPGELFAENRDMRWTGMYLGSGVLTPPPCQFDGQTYEFPGSCRLYYQCPNDGPIEITSCCPGLYSPSAGACISEDEANVDAVCAPLDICD